VSIAGLIYTTAACCFNFTNLIRLSLTDIHDCLNKTNVRLHVLTVTGVRARDTVEGSVLEQS
jgi:hypothetical protein